MFVACSHCRRHVRDTDGICPFCGTTRPPNGVRRLGTALAMGVVTCVACGGETNIETDAGPGGQSSGGRAAVGGGPLPAYGPPPYVGGTSTTGGTASGGVPMTAYGPPPYVGGTRATGGTMSAAGAYGPPPYGGASTGGKSTGGMPIAAYGPAPIGGASTGGKSSGGMPAGAYGPPPLGGTGG